MFCSKCGNKINDGDSFCVVCGEKNRLIDNTPVSNVQVIEREEVMIEPLLPNSVLIFLVFGALCFSILLILLLSLFTKNIDSASLIILNNILCR